MRYSLDSLKEMTDKQLEQVIEQLGEDKKALEQIRACVFEMEKLAGQIEADDLEVHFDEYISPEIQNELNWNEKTAMAAQKELDDIPNQRRLEGWDWRRDYDEIQNDKLFRFD